jgi:hypothetical protein
MARRRDLLLRLKGLGPAFSSQLTNDAFYKDFRNRSEVQWFRERTANASKRFKVSSIR